MNNPQSVDDLRNNQQVQPFVPPPVAAPMILESAATAMAAQAKAQVEARYTMAIHRPRNWDQVRIDILNECRRPSFAHNKSAYYKKPIGQGVEGLGIRFTEIALRWMTNVMIESNLIFEDDLKEVHRITVTDLESNLTYPMDVRVSRTVERQKVPEGVIPISSRKNSYGKDVYTIPATDDELLNKRGALISKAIRTLGNRIIPGDIQDEAIDIILKVRLDKAAEDPDAEAKRIMDAFAKIKVSATDLTKYLGHDIKKCSPVELVDLRAIYGTIRDGEASWSAVMENKAEQGPASKPETIVNPVTGEVFDPIAHLSPSKTNQDGSFTKRPHRGKSSSNPAKVDPLAKFIKPIEAAKDVAELDLAVDLINGPDVELTPDEKKRVEAAYSKRAAEMQAGGESEDPGAGFGGME